MTIDKMMRLLKLDLPPKRFQHSLGVADEAKKMAKRFGENPEKAYLAGLLHDCAKGYDTEKQKELSARYGLELDEVTLLCPGVIHAPLGAEIAKDVYGVADGEVLDAIRYHTVGRAGMTALDKIIYVADMIEPSRTFDGVEDLRAFAKKSLDTAFFESLRQGLKHNIKKGNIVHPASIYAWNYCLAHGAR